MKNHGSIMKRVFKRSKQERKLSSNVFDDFEADNREFNPVRQALYFFVQPGVKCKFSRKPPDRIWKPRKNNHGLEKLPKDSRNISPKKRRIDICQQIAHDARIISLQAKPVSPENCVTLSITARF